MEIENATPSVAHAPDVEQKKTKTTKVRNYTILFWISEWRQKKKSGVDSVEHLATKDFLPKELVRINKMVQELEKSEGIPKSKFWWYFDTIRTSHALNADASGRAMRLMRMRPDKPCA